MWNTLSRWKTPLASLGGFALGALSAFLVLASGLLAPVAPPVKTEEWGTFPTRPVAELLDNGRDLKLLEDFAYIDPRGRVWSASKGSIVNGASIPRAFWTITGGPLEGEFRNASIIHDEGCVRMNEPWENVHLMFYEACRCGGVPELKAKSLYAAVYHFGPRWTSKPVYSTQTVKNVDGTMETKMVARTVTELVQPEQPQDPELAQKLLQLIQKSNPSIEELQKLNPDEL